MPVLASEPIWFTGMCRAGDEYRLRQVRALVGDDGLAYVRRHVARVPGPGDIPRLLAVAERMGVRHERPHTTAAWTEAGPDRTVVCAQAGLLLFDIDDFTRIVFACAFGTPDERVFISDLVPKLKLLFKTTTYTLLYGTPGSP